MPAQPLTAALLNDTFPGIVADTQNTLSNITSTSYVETFANPAAVAFVAPVSGRVLIYNSAYLDNSSATARTYLSWDLRAGGTIGSGVDIVSASDATAIENLSANDGTVGRTYTVGGLTPGASYHVQQSGRVTSGTGEYQNRHLIVKPAPN